MLRKHLTERYFKRTIKHWLSFAWWLLVLQFVDGVVSHLENSRQSLAEILVVRVDGIGDFVLFLDAARKLREIFPANRFRITLLGNQLWTSLARGQSCFDEIWDLSPTRFAFDLVYRYRVLTRVRRAGFSVLLNPTFSRDLLWADAIARSSGCEQRIGFFGDLYKITSLARSLSARWYTRLITGIEPETNELQKSQAFVEALTTKVASVEVPRLDVMDPVPSGLPVYFYVLCPGSGDSLKRWAPENFAEIAQKIFSEKGWPGLVCGGQNDSIFAAKLIARAGVPLKNYCGKLSLPGLAGTLAASKLLVANDTGAVHIAAAVGTPAVCIVGGGHPGRFLPYSPCMHEIGRCPIVVSQPMECFGCDWHCKYRIEKNQAALCVSQISVTTVWKMVQLLLDEVPANGSSL
jgi:ADP-heptose:LPS heptosyltransferase